MVKRIIGKILSFKKKTDFWWKRCPRHQGPEFLANFQSDLQVCLYTEKRECIWNRAIFAGKSESFKLKKKKKQINTFSSGRTLKMSGYDHEFQFRLQVNFPASLRDHRSAPCLYVLPCFTYQRSASRSTVIYPPFGICRYVVSACPDDFESIINPTTQLLDDTVVCVIFETSRHRTC